MENWLLELCVAFMIRMWRKGRILLKFQIESQSMLKCGNPQTKSARIETLNSACLHAKTFQQMSMSVTGLGIYNPEMTVCQSWLCWWNSTKRSIRIKNRDPGWGKLAGWRSRNDYRKGKGSRTWEICCTTSIKVQRSCCTQGGPGADVGF